MSERRDHNGGYCIVGAGASGLAVAKTFKQRNIPFHCLEREEDIGGLWNAGTPTGVVYKTCHMVSSRDFTGFEDFPFSEEDPVFPHHIRATSYLKEYAEHFGIRGDIECGKAVRRIAFEDGAWRVQVAGERRARAYRGVVLANGHHDVPRWPSWPGEFTGEMLHSRDYRGPEQLAGKRVLVVGAGNSGCDIVVDGVHHGAEIHHSLRRGCYFVPKFTFGLPTDDVVSFTELFRPPRWLKQRLYRLVNRLLTGPPHWHGLPEPEHHILDTHPTVSSEIPNHAAHGRIAVKPEIERFDGRTVIFTDGSSAEIDIVICATGYEMSFPFIDDRLILGEDGLPKLYLNVFHPQRDDLFAAGLVQANGSIWRLADYQARLIASYIVAMHHDKRRAERFRRRKAAGAVPLAARGTFVASERHRLEHDYYVYRRALKRQLRKFGPCAENALGEEPRRRWWGEPVAAPVPATGHV